MKRVLSMILCLVFVLSLLSGCGAAPAASSSSAPAEQPKAEEPKTGETAGIKADLEDSMEDVEATNTGAGVKIGLVITTTLGDKAIGDTCWMGLNNLKAEYPDLEIKVYEAPNGSVDYEPNLLAATDWADLVICNANSMGDILEKVAADNPDKPYISNERKFNDKDNITSCVFCCNEIGFLCGILAGMFTQDTSIPGINEEHIVGFVSGQESPTCKDYYTGFEYGVKYTCPDAIILQTWTGNFTDVVAAKEAAKGQIAQGADVILPVISSCCVGVFEACQEAGVYSFGLDINKDADAAGTLITSALKCADVTTYNYGKRFLEDGKLEPGFTLLGIAEHGTDITDMATIKEAIPEAADTIEAIRLKAVELEQAVVDGKIEVPYWPAVRGE